MANISGRQYPNTRPATAPGMGIYRPDTVGYDRPKYTYGHKMGRPHPRLTPGDLALVGLTRGDIAPLPSSSQQSGSNRQDTAKKTAPTSSRYPNRDHRKNACRNKTRVQWKAGLEQTRDTQRISPASPPNAERETISAIEQGTQPAGGGAPNPAAGAQQKTAAGNAEGDRQVALHASRGRLEAGPLTAPGPRQNCRWRMSARGSHEVQSAAARRHCSRRERGPPAARWLRASTCRPSAGRLHA